MKQHLTLTISGIVQGVFFRAHTQEKAQELTIQGYVTNMDDGSVFIEAEGDEKNLQQFLLWCSHGPTRAVVKHIDHSFSTELQNYDAFEIR